MDLRIVTDSNAMLPADLRRRYGIRVVPLTIVIDGVAHLEDALDPIDFCRQLRAGADVSTAAPSPGQVLAAYEELAAAGAEEILSIHVGANQSGTCNAARLAADDASVPVTVVDTGVASFIEGCCVWRAAEVLAAGGSAAEALLAAGTVGSTSASVFTLGELDRALAGGRFDLAPHPDVPVFVTEGPDMAELGRAATAQEAITTMVERLGSAPGPLRVGIGDADAAEAADRLVEAVGVLANVEELVRYTVGPSVATHTGAGTFGAVYHPLSANLP